MTLNSDQQIVRIKITGDPDGTGKRTGIFEMVSAPDTGLTVTHKMRTGYVINDRGKAVNSILSEVAGDGEAKNKGIFVDLGTSQYVLEAEFKGYSGGDYQWGDTGNGGSGTDATGDGPIAQAQVFGNWVRSTQIDSLPEEFAGEVTGSYGPATLEFGLHHPGGPLDPLDVVLENPTLTPSDPGALDGNITMIEAASLGEAYDASGNSKLGSGST